MKNWTLKPHPLAVDCRHMIGNFIFIDWKNWMFGTHFAWCQGFRGLVVHVGPIDIHLGMWIK